MRQFGQGELLSRAKTMTPDQLLTRGLRVVQRQITELERMQKAGILEHRDVDLLVRLVEVARKAASDQNSPRRLLEKMTEAELERLASGETEPIKTKT